MRNTTTRDKHRRTIARSEPPCGICGQPIDYRIPYRRPDGTVHPYAVELVHHDGRTTEYARYGD